MKKQSSKNEAALVTGAAQRIGAAMAIALAEKGYDIALHYFRSRKKAEKTAEAIRKTGRNCKLFKADLKSEAQSKKMMSQVLRNFPKLEVLIHNASTYKPASFLETKPALYDENFNLHVKTVFFLTQAFAQKVKQGQVINFVDAKVRQNKTAHFVYLLSKKTLLQFTEMAALALAPRIRVNAIAPGAILPPPGKNESYLKKMVQLTPLQKPISLEEVRLALFTFLENPALTGQCIYVDGGMQVI